MKRRVIGEVMAAEKGVLKGRSFMVTLTLFVVRSPEQGWDMDCRQPIHSAYIDGPLDDMVGSVSGRCLVAITWVNRSELVVAMILTKFATFVAHKLIEKSWEGANFRIGNS
jgi:hypothetical protein